MQTRLPAALRRTVEGREADSILRSCVHCGFCNATCPTYQVLGDERDGPRGRIYLIKEMLESGSATRETQVHLDRCLTCRACETTCPSGVQYGRLLEFGRAVAEMGIRRPATERILRNAIARLLPSPGRFRRLAAAGRLLRPVLPARLRASLPAAPVSQAPWPAAGHDRRVLLLQGCVQSVTAPDINGATARVLDRLGVEARPGDGCCGALAQHLSRETETLAAARRNIDRWWPEIEAGAEAIVLTATGCVPTVQDYGRLLADDPAYAERAARVSELAIDLSALLEQEPLEDLFRNCPDPGPVAFHAPCTLQHGLKRAGRVEALLRRGGFELTGVADAHLCCGSAGSYSLLQRSLSEQLKAAKIENLERGGPAILATANIGCLMHLQSGTSLPVRHWIQLLDPAERGPRTRGPRVAD
jgi:glycolate oxidase iron-sulfur subunit